MDAWPVIAYMHIIDSNYLDQNFIQHLDFTKYQEFLDGTYEFKDAQGNPIDYDILSMESFPKLGAGTILDVLCRILNVDQS